MAELSEYPSNDNVVTVGIAGDSFAHACLPGPLVFKEPHGLGLWASCENLELLKDMEFSSSSFSDAGPVIPTRV